MNPTRPVVDLRSRDWRTQLKAAIDLATGTGKPVEQRGKDNG